MFRKFHKLKTRHQLVVAVLVAFAVVSFWRGVWGLMDELLFPDNYQLSLWVSLFVGLIILIATGYATKELM
jgi:NhaP-type Na+/H+ and K+/H+ antiporter